MKKSLLILLVNGLIVGCATTGNRATDLNKMPRGHWYHVNEEGFIPPNTDIYMKSGNSYVKQRLEQPLVNEQPSVNQGAE